MTKILDSLMIVNSVIYYISIGLFCILIIFIFSACSPLTSINHEVRTSYKPHYNIFQSFIAQPYQEELKMGKDGGLIIADGTSALLHRLAFVQMAQKSKNVRDFIFLSPFFMEANKEDAMRKMCDEYAAIMRRVAKKNNRPFVDIQAEFDKFLQHRSGIGLSWDRVHPYYIGAMIIARAILREIGFDRPLF